MFGVKEVLVAGAAFGLLMAGGASVAAPAKKAAPATIGAKPTVSATAAAAAKLATAFDLAAYGREKSDPQALILAAKMMNEAGAQNATLQTRTTGGQADRDAKTAKPETTAASLLDEAESLARGDAGVLAQVAEVRAAAQKGFIGGPRRSVIRIPARAVVSWSGVARAGEQAIAAAQGDGDTDIDIKVYDGNGGLICQDVLGDYTPVCPWVPAWTGAFTVRIINNGYVYSDTVFVTN